MRIPGYRSCSWTSRNRKECHWIWKVPSTSSLGTGGSPVSLLFSLSTPFSYISLQTCFLIYLWFFCCPQTCPGLGLSHGQISASGSLTCRLHLLRCQSSQLLAVSLLNSQERIWMAHLGSCVRWSNQRSSEVVCATS